MAHTMENHPPHTTWNQPHQLDRIYNTYLSIKISLFTLIASSTQTLTPACWGTELINSLPR